MEVAVTESSYETFMSEAEIIIQKYTDLNPLLALWRCNQPMPFDLQNEVEMILVGVPDENKPSLPSDLIVFRVWLSPSAAHVDFINGSYSEYSRVPFGDGNKPIDYVEKLARKLPTI